MTCPSCGYDAPMPPGYVVLSDGEVTASMQQWAEALVADARTNYGDEFDRNFSLTDGAQGLVTARIEHHAYTVDPSGKVVCGCFKGATLYHAPLRAPSHPSSPAAASDTGLTPAGYFSLALILFSTAFGVASAIYAGRRVHMPSTEHHLAKVVRRS